MTLIGFFASEKTPRSFDIDPSGQFLSAGGQGSGKLAAYRMEHTTGKLKLFKTSDVGEHSAWVLIVQMNEAEK